MPPALRRAKRRSTSDRARRTWRCVRRESFQAGDANAFGFAAGRRVLDFWPRNEIVFTEGIIVHSAEFLRQVAVETGHWFRLAASAVTATTAFIGFLRYHREEVR